MAKGANGAPIAKGGAKVVPGTPLTIGGGMARLVSLGLTNISLRGPTGAAVMPRAVAEASITATAAACTAAAGGIPIAVELAGNGRSKPLRARAAVGFGGGGSGGGPNIVGALGPAPCPGPAELGSSGAGSNSRMIADALGSPDGKSNSRIVVEALGNGGNEPGRGRCGGTGGAVAARTWFCAVGAVSGRAAGAAATTWV